MRDYFSRVAPVWEAFKRKNSYYHERLGSFIQLFVPPGKQVLEFGSGTGELLQLLQPSRGVGLNVAEHLTESATRQHASLEFLTTDVDQIRVPPGFTPDYVILTNMLDYTYDISDFLKSLRPIISDQTLVVITTSNPLWAPALRLASRWGFRVPDSPRNFITNKDIRNVLQLESFDVVQEGMLTPVPRRIPLIAPVLNALIPDVPVLRYCSSVQYIVSRPRAPRAPLSCSVVIPCHNEADNIQECVARVPAMGAFTEILVVDDGSTDATRERAMEAMKQRPGVRLLTTDANQGKANAVRAGFEHARGDVVMILDADMTVLPEDLPRFLAPLQNGSADFVNGTRLVYPMAGQAMRLANYLGNKAFCFLVSWIFRQRVSDTLCGTKALFRREVPFIDHAETERWGDFELLFGAARLGLRILEIPIHYHERRAGKSKMRVLYDGWLFLFTCLRGWKTLRFPTRHPWSSVRSSLAGWREVEVER
jgi:ubiquinone/menaquinone biosynthesis C-methylase UbiE